MKWGQKVKAFVEEDKPRVGFFLGEHQQGGDTKGIIQVGDEVYGDFAYRGAEDAEKDGNGRTYREV